MRARLLAFPYLLANFAAQISLADLPAPEIFYLTEYPVSETDRPGTGIGRDRCRYILCRFFISDMDDPERDTISPCALFWFTNALQMWYTFMGCSYLAPMQLITTGVLKIMGK